MATLFRQPLFTRIAPVRRTNLSFDESSLLLTTLNGSVILLASVGAFAVTGNTALFAVSQPSSAGSYAVTGNAAALNTGLTSSAGSFAVSGVAALFGTKLTSATGSYTVTGNAAVFGSTLLSAAGAYTVTGNAAVFGAALASAAGAYSVTGVNAILAQGLVLTASAGSYVVTGYPSQYSITNTINTIYLSQHPVNCQMEGNAPSIKQMNNTVEWAAGKAGTKTTVSTSGARRLSQNEPSFTSVTKTGHNV